jgi:hypothetical protein
MSLRVYYEVLNQKGSPALYTDTFANRPAFGFQGRLFISTDTGQIFEDTGSAWTLVADAGVGGGTLSSVTANGNTTAFGIVVTAGGLSSTTGTFSDIVTAPQVKASTSAGLSFNSNNGTQVAVLGAGGGANLTFYGGLTGTSGSFTSMQVLNGGVGSIQTDFVQVNNQLAIITRTGGPTYTTGTDNIGSVTAGLYITRGLNGGGILAFDSSATYTYTYPASNGTLALTSQTGSITAGSYFLTGMTAGNGALYWSSDRVTLANYNVGGSLLFEVNGGAEAMRINSEGNIGIGVTPSAWLSIYSAIEIGRVGDAFFSGSGGGPVMSGNAYYGVSGWTYARNAPATNYDAGEGTHRWYTAISGTAGANATMNEKMKITNEGNLNIEGNGNGFTIGQASGVNRIDWNGSTFRFLGTANSFVPIAASAFNVNSDYRLKEDFKQFDNSLELINKIKIYDFKWIDKDERNYGVIAHELQETLPYIVYGEKDGMEPNGEIRTQGVDYGKLVPILVKAIQEQQTQIEALEFKINSLQF